MSLVTASGSCLAPQAVSVPDLQRRHRRRLSARCRSAISVVVVATQNGSRFLSARPGSCFRLVPGDPGRAAHEWGPALFGPCGFRTVYGGRSSVERASRASAYTPPCARRWSNGRTHLPSDRIEVMLPAELPSGPAETIVVAAPAPGEGARAQAMGMDVGTGWIADDFDSPLPDSVQCVRKRRAARRCSRTHEPRSKGPGAILRP
jgi:hypothetical protein